MGIPRKSSVEAQAEKTRSRIPVGTEFILEEPARRVGRFWTAPVLLVVVSFTIVLAVLALALLP